MRQLLSLALSLSVGFLIGTYRLIDSTSSPSALNERPFADKHTTVEYYKVSGENETEIRQALNQIGPTDQFGRRRDAYTSWQVTWRWPFKPDGSPDFANVTAKYRVKVILPQWVEYSKASPKLKRSWDKFLTSMIEHESGHIANVRNRYDLVAQRIREEFKKNPAMEPSQANEIGQTVLSGIRELDIHYDTNTLSGALQGVKFP